MAKASESTLMFYTVSRPWKLPETDSFAAYLIGDNWDDYGFETTYMLIFFDADGTKHEIGYVKIAQYESGKIKNVTKIPEIFDALNDSFFSLGQSDKYYEKLNQLGKEIRERVLVSLRDVAWFQDLWLKVEHLPVVEKSFLRGISRQNVVRQFSRIARGGVRLTDYHFTYTMPEESDRSGISLEFNVVPNVFPPTNIHVLIGQNGTGKTHILNFMAKALVLGNEEEVGVFHQENPDESSRPFANLVSVAFSAFDPFLPLPEAQNTPTGIHYSYIGLKTTGMEGNFGAPKTIEALTDEFVNSLDNCIKTLRIERWRNAIRVLEVDRNFADKGFSRLAAAGEKEVPKAIAIELFRSLSSGHKIVLLTITRLVEETEERTLILLDEPEAHLHPPLLSAFIRSLSDLLTDRNGVAIIATHSPVVLQEVPRNCVLKLLRSGHEVHVSRPGIETFGENVGILTREVFRLEVERSGFHKLLSDVAGREPTFDSAVKYFNDALGAEARAMLRAMYANK